MSYLARSSWLWLILLLQPLGEVYAANAPTVVRFCAPHNDVYPFYVTKNDKLTGINPDILLQIFNPASLPDAKLVIVMRPWKRCNADLQKGLVDMIIGGFSPNREGVAYPSELGLKLEESVISTAEVCFTTVEGEQMERTQQGMQGQGSFIVGIEAGFSKQHSRNIRPRWVELFNPDEKYQLLEKGRVDAIVQVCAMDGDNPIKTVAQTMGFDNFTPLFPPYLSNPAYAVFSQQFAEAHPDLAKRIVRQSTLIDKSEIYQRYRP